MSIVRGHHEGSIYRLAQRGVWVAAISLPDGRRRRRQAPSRAAALAALRSMQKAITAEAIDASRIRLGDYLERWVSDDHGWSPATARKHASIVRTHLVPACGFTRLSELSVADAEAVVARRPGLAPRTQSHVRATLRRALADAVRDGLCNRNVAGLSRPVKQSQRERPTLDATQARRLIESTRGTRHGPLWALLVTTGLRISEALGLSWADVELGGSNEGGDDHRLGVWSSADAARSPDVGVGHRPSRSVGAVPRGGTITVRHALQRVDGEWQRRPPKTAKGRRTIPLTPLAVEALRQRREDQAADRGATLMEGLVFTTSTGHPIHATNLLPRLRADLAAAGLPKVGLHDLRHSCATILFSLGVPIEVIADILGHSTVRVTQDLYRHRIPEMSVEAARKMQEALA